MELEDTCQEERGYRRRESGLEEEIEFSDKIESY
jgi:hypothetical protein